MMDTTKTKIAAGSYRLENESGSWNVTKADGARWMICRINEEGRDVFAGISGSLAEAVEAVSKTDAEIEVEIAAQEAASSDFWKNEAEAFNYTAGAEISALAGEYSSVAVLGHDGIWHDAPLADFRTTSDPTAAFAGWKAALLEVTAEPVVDSCGNKIETNDPDYREAIADAIVEKIVASFSITPSAEAVAAFASEAVAGEPVRFKADPEGYLGCSLVSDPIGHAIAVEAVASLSDVAISRTIAELEDGIAAEEFGHADADPIVALLKAEQDRRAASPVETPESGRKGYAGFDPSDNCFNCEIAEDCPHVGFETAESCASYQKSETTDEGDAIKIGDKFRPTVGEFRNRIGEVNAIRYIVGDVGRITLAFSDGRRNEFYAGDLADAIRYEIGQEVEVRVRGHWYAGKVINRFTGRKFDDREHYTIETTIAGKVEAVFLHGHEVDERSRFIL